jgi:hypothetical protein
MTTEREGKAEKTPPEKSSNEKIQPPGHVGPRTVPAVEQAHGGGLEQVREIVFGAAYRDLEQRLTRADMNAAGRVRDLEQESRRRDELLEAHLRKETETLASRVDRQFAEVSESLRTLGREHTQSAADAERRIARAEEALATGLREVRHQLLDQAKSFLAELQAMRKEMLATLQRELALDDGEVLEERDAQSGASH